MADNLMRLLAEGTGEDGEEGVDRELRSAAVEAYFELLDRPKLPAVLLKVGGAEHWRDGVGWAVCVVVGYGNVCGDGCLWGCAVWAGVGVIVSTRAAEGDARGHGGEEIMGPGVLHWAGVNSKVARLSQPGRSPCCLHATTALSNDVLCSSCRGRRSASNGDVGVWSCLCR